MANKYWTGAAPAVAQVLTGAIGVFDVASTYTITVGSGVNTFAISVPGVTNASTTATNLKAAANASTHPYFTGITFGGISPNITATADTAGTPFTATLTVTGGTGTVTPFATTVANGSPNDWANAQNWSGDAVPVDTDDVIIRDSTIPILWGLDQNTVDLDSLTIEKSFTTPAKIGLPRNSFTSGVDVEDPSVPEYRDTYLKIGIIDCKIGQNLGSATPDGPSRVKIWNVLAAASRTEVFSTSNSSAETNLPSVRLLFDNAASELFVRSAVSGVGIAVDTPFETSSMALISVNDPTGSARVQVGEGVTYVRFEQFGGNSVIQSAVTLADLYMSGGNLRTEGLFKVTAAVLDGGTWNSNNSDGSDIVADAITLNEGTIDFTGSSIARTVTLLDLFQGGNIVADGAILTITTLNPPPEGAYRIAVS